MIDKVFALSKEEITNPSNGFTNNIKPNKKRKTERTEYGDFLEFDSDYWLRSPDDNNDLGNLTWDVVDDISVYYSDIGDALGVRPAMRIQLDK